MNSVNYCAIWLEINKHRPSLAEGGIWAEQPGPPEPLSAPAALGQAGGRPVEIIMNAWPEDIEGEVILVFASNTEVLNVEDILEEEDLPFELVPVPKEVNPNCGLAISFSGEDMSDIMAALNDGGFVPQAAYIRQGNNFQDLPPFF